MIKKYIRGNQERGSEVLKELEKLGGISHYGHDGSNSEYLYYIDCSDNNGILAVSSEGFFGKLMMECFEEIKLPKEKLKVIRGDKERGEEVIKLLKDMGGWNKLGLKGESRDNYYLLDGNIIACKLYNDEFFKDFELEILELPKPEKGQEPTLEPFQKVLVRDGDNESWSCNLFSHQRIDKACGLNYGCLGGVWWKHCIPYEGNEHLLGTNININ